MTRVKGIWRIVVLVCFGWSLLFGAGAAQAFCGFYVSQADAKLFNQASQVILARDGQRTILTMANDYQGPAKDFALVVPVPTVLKQEQVNVGERRIIERLDAFSAPRLVEYFDNNPCEVYPQSREEGFSQRQSAAPSAAGRAKSDNALGVKIEAQFAVGEYDILILSAQESKGLETWLRRNKYKIPKGAHQALAPYIKQGMKFFVAKVNLKEQARSGFQALRPLMIAYESPKFMLPIRLGMVNAKGPQDLIVHLLSPQGAGELTNYRKTKLPTDLELPEFIQGEFGEFYQALFANSYQKSGRNVAFVEYAWNMANCDPCSAEPLNRSELEKAGVFWLDQGRGSDVFITRLHLRYTPDKFPEDLQFQSTPNQSLYQGRYILRRPYRGEMACSAAQDYRQTTRRRQEKEAQTLAQATGWPLEKIRPRIQFIEAGAAPWWRQIWPF